MHEKHAVPPLPHKAIDNRLASRLRPASPGRIEGIDLVGLGNPTGPNPPNLKPAPGSAYPFGHLPVALARLRERGPCGKNRPPVGGHGGRFFRKRDPGHAAVAQW